MNRYLRFLAIAVVLFLNPFSVAVSECERPPGESDDRSITPGGACSAICLTNNGYAIFGANLDYSVLSEGLIYINPRGLVKTGVDPSTTGEVASWVSRYASITFNFVGYHYPWGGMNEKGLSISTMALYDVSDYPPPDERPPISSGFWVQYILDTCATIEDVIATDADVRIIAVDHYLVADRSGNCAVIECLEGRRVVHTGEDLPVAALTNTAYSVVLEIWQSGFDPFRRFCVAADRVQGFSSMSENAAIDYAFDTLESIDGGLWSEHISQWSVVFDTKNMRAYFRTYTYPEIRYIDLYSFCLSCDTPVQMLDIQANLSGDVAGDFFDYSHDISAGQMDWFVRYYRNEESSEWLQRHLLHFEGFECTDEETPEDVLVSRDLLRQNANPRFAINTNTGNILVVWNQLDADDPSSCVVRSAMLMRSLERRYSSAEAHLLSDEDSYNARPFPVFIERQNRFLVVWDQADPNEPSAESDILGRIVSANGLPEGDILRVLSNGERNESPHLYARTDRSSPTGLTASKAKLIILFNTVNDNNIEDSGLYIAQLNRKFKAKKPRLLMQGGVVDVSGIDIPQRILPSGIGQMIDQTLFLPVVHEMVQGNGTTLDQPKIIVVNRSNSLVDSENLGQAGAAQPNLAVFENSQGDIIVIASTLRNRKVFNSVMEFSASQQSPALTPLFESTEKKKSIASLIIVLAPTMAEQEKGSVPIAYKTIGYQILAATNGRVYRRGLSESGTTVGQYKKVFVAGRSLQDMLGAEILFACEVGDASTAEILIIWQKKITSEHHEIRAHFLSIKR